MKPWPQCQPVTKSLFRDYPQRQHTQAQVHTFVWVNRQHQDQERSGHGSVETGSHSRYLAYAQCRAWGCLLRWWDTYLSTIYSQSFPFPLIAWRFISVSVALNFQPRFLSIPQFLSLNLLFPGWRGVCALVSHDQPVSVDLSLSLGQFPEPSQITVPLSVCADSSLNSITVMALFDHAAGELVTTNDLTWLISVPRQKHAFPPSLS